MILYRINDAPIMLSRLEKKVNWYKRFKVLILTFAKETETFS